MNTKPELDALAVLDSRPTQNVAVRVANNESGVVLFVPIARPGWLRALSWLLPLRREKGFALDALGREVWLACDGARSFEKIVLEFAERHQLRFHEARAMVSSFLKTLSERNLVALVVAKEASSA
ncbi:MAG TPA: PqqD family protein [Polyangiaceae bacterium]|nr:PqqD family protein [Polyangiaceae bacterium]